MGNSSSKKSRSDSAKGHKPSRKSSFRRFISGRQKTKESRAPPKLYISNANASCRMVWLYCIEHGVPVELQFLEDKRGLTTTDEFHSMNPFHTVPVLKDGDVVLFESVAILHYLAQEYSNFAGFGPDAATRAKAGSIVCWASKNLLKAVGYHYVFPQFIEEYKLHPQKANDALIDHGLGEVRNILDTLQSEHLTKHPYLLGSECTVADICVGVILSLLDSTDFDWDPWPKVSAWMERMKERAKWEVVNASRQEQDSSEKSAKQAKSDRSRRPVVSMMLVDAEEEERQTEPSSSQGVRVQVHVEDGKAEAVVDKEEANGDVEAKTEEEQKTVEGESNEIEKEKDQPEQPNKATEEETVKPEVTATVQETGEATEAVEDSDKVEESLTAVEENKETDNVESSEKDDPTSCGEGKESDMADKPDTVKEANETTTEDIQPPPDESTVEAKEPVSHEQVVEETQLETRDEPPVSEDQKEVTDGKLTEDVVEAVDVPEEPKPTEQNEGTAEDENPTERISNEAQAPAEGEVENKEEVNEADVKPEGQESETVEEQESKTLDGPEDEKVENPPESEVEESKQSEEQ